MNPTELYRKYRPRSLRAVIGQDQTTAALQNMIEKGTLPHCILFHGPSGCGKTTLARILKGELKCHNMDFREMNCADFRGIDTIRSIREVMNLAPTGGKVRIWLLDEAHQLSKDGQNAALKMLEDTPSHVYFMLASTDPQKLLKTIQTRCCEMPVRPLGQAHMEQLITRVLKREKKSLNENVIEEIIISSQGSARMALVLLDKVIHLDRKEQLEAVTARVAEANEASELCRALIQKRDWRDVAAILKNLKGEPESIRYAVLGYARSVLLSKKNAQAYNVLQAFRDNFYDSKAAGLVAASFEAIHG